ELIAALSRAASAKSMRKLDSDDVVGIVGDQDPTKRDMALKTLGDADWLAVEQALSFPERSARWLMQHATFPKACLSWKACNPP
ncbi:MAG: hypothetical protein WCS20_03495, partial [Alphaproteobacteria bacterium]